MAIFKACNDCQKFYFDKRYTEKCKDCREKTKKRSDRQYDSNMQ